MSKTVVLDDPIIAAVWPRLRDAATLGHSRRSFLAHLFGTWQILTDWRMPVAVCRAGLMHSAYSTSFYPHALFGLNERDTLRRMIGRDAEDLVFRFCTMDRRGFWDRLARQDRAGTSTYSDRTRSGARVRISRQTLNRLMILESANVVEQCKAVDGGPAPWMSRVLRWWGFLDERYIPPGFDARTRLSRKADEDAIAAYRIALEGSATRAASLLDRAIECNPWAAEPRILRALCGVETHDCAAIVQAQRGVDLLSSWAVAWDKRVSANAWSSLADRVQRAARRRSALRFDFGLVCAVLNGRAPKPRWLAQ